jgi:dCTP deaminase
MLISKMPKNDRWIREMASQGMIEPFELGQKVQGVISSGIGSYGYDMRVADEFRVFMPKDSGGMQDPKAFNDDNYVDYKGSVCVIPPNSYALGRSLEYFRIPRDIVALCYGKSTYARCGIVVNVTPLEPEWEGFVTISISNTTPLPARIYSNEGIAQVVFFGVPELCEVSYADRGGKYQAQKSITPPRISGTG